MIQVQVAKDERGGRYGLAESHVPIHNGAWYAIAKALAGLHNRTQPHKRDQPVQSSQVLRVEKGSETAMAAWPCYLYKSHPSRPGLPRHDPWSVVDKDLYLTALGT